MARIINGIDFTDPMKPGEVAEAFAVHSNTVTRWAKSGRLATTRTLGGQHRFSRVQVEELLRDGVMGVPDLDEPSP